MLARKSKSPDQLITSVIRRLQQAIDQSLDRKLAPLKLTSRQVLVMETVLKYGGCKQTRLVELTGIDRSTITDIVRRLVDRRLIERVRSKTDARAYSLSLTTHGKTLIKKATQIKTKTERQAEQALGPKLAGFKSQAIKLRANIEQQ